MSHKPREEIFFRKEEMINIRSSEIKIKLEELEFIMKVFWLTLRQSCIGRIMGDEDESPTEVLELKEKLGNEDCLGQTQPVGTLCWSKVIQSCLTLCDPMDCSLQGSSVHGIFQATGMDCHFLLQGNLPDPGIEPGSPALLYHLSNQGSPCLCCSDFNEQRGFEFACIVCWEGESTGTGGELDFSGTLL